MAAPNVSFRSKVRGEGVQKATSAEHEIVPARVTLSIRLSRVSLVR